MPLIGPPPLVMDYSPYVSRSHLEECNVCLAACLFTPRHLVQTVNYHVSCYCSCLLVFSLSWLCFRLRGFSRGKKREEVVYFLAWCEKSHMTLACSYPHPSPFFHRTFKHLRLRSSPAALMFTGLCFFSTQNPKFVSLCSKIKDHKHLSFHQLMTITPPL